MVAASYTSKAHWPDRTEVAAEEDSVYKYK